MFRAVLIYDAGYEFTPRSDYSEASRRLAGVIGGIWQGAGWIERYEPDGCWHRLPGDDYFASRNPWIFDN